MPLPQKAIEQLSREPVQTQGWSSRLLMISATVFFASLMVYVGLVFGYKPYLSGQQDEVKRSIDQFAEDVPPEKQRDIANFYSQTDNLKRLIASQQSPAGLVGWFEAHAHQDIRYTRFMFNAKNRQLDLSGLARTESAVAEQIKIFESLPDEVRFTTGSGVIPDQTTGLWQFSLSVSFNQGFLEKLQAPSTQTLSQ